MSNPEVKAKFEKDQAVKDEPGKKKTCAGVFTIMEKAETWLSDKESNVSIQAVMVGGQPAGEFQVDEATGSQSSGLPPPPPPSSGVPMPHSTIPGPLLAAQASEAAAKAAAEAEASEEAKVIEKETKRRTEILSKLKPEA